MTVWTTMGISNLSLKWKIMVWNLKRSFCSLQCTTNNCRLESSANSQQTAFFFPAGSDPERAIYFLIQRLQGTVSVFTTWVWNKQRAQLGVCWWQSRAVCRFLHCFCGRRRNSKAEIKVYYILTRSFFSCFHLSISDMFPCSQTHTHTHIVVMQPGEVVHCFSS